MNKYHPHRSRGIREKSGKARGMLRCPFTGKLLHGGNSKIKVIWGAIVHSNATRGGLTLWVHKSVA